MKIRRFTAAAVGCLALTVVAPASATAFPLVNLLPTGIADLIGSGSANPFAPPPPAPAPAPAPPVAPAPPAPAPAPQQSTPAPAPQRSAPSGGYKNCTEAWNAGVAPLYRDEPGYAPRLDRDDDGKACEVDPR